jgi:nitrogenase molybdenum-iron protein alpha/beta subunit
VKNNIVLGGEKKTLRFNHEAKKSFPDAQGVLYMPHVLTGLIGDDIEAVGNACSKPSVKPVVAFNCPVLWVARVLVHHVGNEMLFNNNRWHRGTKKETPYDINLIVSTTSR